MVVCRVPSACRSATRPSAARSRLVHRRFGFRLGRFSRGRPPVRLVVSGVLSSFHQPPGPHRGSLRDSGVPSCSSVPVSLLLHGQHHSSVLSEESGRDSLHAELCGSGHSLLVRGPSDSPGTSVCSGKSECPRCSQVLVSEWTLCHQAFRELLRLWPANIDLFATPLTARLPVYFSPVADPHSAGTDTVMQPWDGLQAYAFPPFGLLHRVLSMVRQSRGLELTHVAPLWPQRPWFPDLLVAVPVFLPQRKDLLRQPHFYRFHQNLPVLRLTAFRISSDPPAPSASLQQWLVSLPPAGDLPPG